MSRRRFYMVVTGVAAAAVVSVVLLTGLSREGPDAVTQAGALVPVPGGEVQSGVVAPRPALVENTSVAGGPAEGISVHGHWVIEVREPDGHLVSRHEFDNAFSSAASGTLARLLARQKTVGIWKVILSSSPNLFNGPCVNSVGNGSSCVLTESLSSSTSPNVFKNLIPVAPPSGAGSLTLSGTATAQRDGLITRVLTNILECAPSLAPTTSCASGVEETFTSTGLTPSHQVTVSNGQDIQVTVTISFQP